MARIVMVHMTMVVAVMIVTEIMIMIRVAMRLLPCLAHEATSFA